MSTLKRLLVEGLTDAVGFVAGALLGWGLSHLLGLQLFAEGYGRGSIIAIALVGLGGGAGLQMARIWRNRNNNSSN
ncbi:MAG: hypothetical protein RSD57_06040 [Comamonas sp.]